MNFTRNALTQTANIPENGCAKSGATTATGAVIATADMIAEGGIETGIVIATGGAAATNATARSIGFYAARSTASATAWNQSCAISNASSAPCSKPSKNAS
jgi:hypothetical protein